MFRGGEEGYWQAPISILRSPLSSLHTYYTIFLGVCQEGFSNFFENFYLDSRTPLLLSNYFIAGARTVLRGVFPLDYVLIIAHLFWFVKNFFYFLFLDFVRSTWKQSLAFLRIGIGTAFYISLSFILQSYYTTYCGVCQEVFHNFFKKFRGL